MATQLPTGGSGSGSGSGSGIWIGLLRFGMACFALLLIGSAIAEIAFPDVVHRENPDPPTAGTRWIMAVLWIGYGMFLLLPPSLLAARRVLLFALGAAVAANVAWMISNLFSQSGASAPQALTLTMMFLTPLVIQSALVHRSWLGRANAPHPPTAT